MKKIQKILLLSLWFVSSVGVNANRIEDMAASWEPEVSDEVNFEIQLLIESGDFDDELEQPGAIARLLVIAKRSENVWLCDYIRRKLQSRKRRVERAFDTEPVLDAESDNEEVSDGEEEFEGGNLVGLADVMDVEDAAEMPMRLAPQPSPERQRHVAPREGIRRRVNLDANVEPNALAHLLDALQVQLEGLAITTSE